MEYYQLSCSPTPLDLEKIKVGQLVWGEETVVEGEPKPRRVPFVRTDEEVFANGEYLLKPAM